MKGQNPFFSVIIPTKNRVELLAQCIQSVLDQTFQDFEIIVVDDGSTDGTKDMIKILQSDKIIYTKNPGEERSAARNYGFQISNGQYICFIDDDDFISNKYLESFSNAIGLDDRLLHRVEFQYVKGNKIIQPTKIETTNNIFFNTFTNMIGVYTLCFPREILEHVEFNENLYLWEDTDFILRVLLKGYNINQLDIKAYYYNIHDEMGSMKLLDEKTFNNSFHHNIYSIEQFFSRNPKVYYFIPTFIKSYLIQEKRFQYLMILISQQFKLKKYAFLFKEAFRFNNFKTIILYEFYKIRLFLISRWGMKKYNKRWQEFLLESEAKN